MAETWRSSERHGDSFPGLKIILQIWRLRGNFCRAHGPSPPSPSWHLCTPSLMAHVFMMDFHSLHTKKIKTCIEILHRIFFLDWPIPFTGGIWGKISVYYNSWQCLWNNNNFQFEKNLKVLFFIMPIFPQSFSLDFLKVCC